MSTGPTEPHDDPPGASVAGYVVEREVGRGGMATVYAAYDAKHDRRVAIKVLHVELTALLGAERFVQEIRVTARLQHPHILGLLDSGVFGPEAGRFAGRPYYVMPYVEGESLRQRLDREGPLPVGDALRLAQEVAAALDYAHRHGVIHRDIKPENLLLHDGGALVADFGIALAVVKAGAMRLTQTGLSLGTPQYMAPEQAAGERTVDARADVYALGAVLYEMLAGEPPFTGPTAQAVVARLMTERPAGLSARRPSVPRSLEAAVRRALEKVPGDRYASASAFAQALTDGAPEMPRWDRAPRTTDARWRRRVPWVLAALASLAAVVALARGAARGGTATPPAVVVSALLPPEGEEFSTMESFGALSPDGRRFAFVSQSPRGEARIWIRSLDSLAATPLPGTEGAAAPFWSPDGASLAFFAGDRLWRLDLAGGGRRVLCAASKATSGVWGDDGTIYFGTVRGLERTTGSGGVCTVAVARGSHEDAIRHPTALSDHRYVLFTSQPRGIPAYDSMVTVLADVRTGNRRVLARRFIEPTFVPPDLVLFGRLEYEGLGRVFAQRLDMGTLTLRADPVPLTGPVASEVLVFSYAASRDALVYLGSRGDVEKLVVDRHGDVLDTLRQPDPADAFTFRLARSHPWVAVGTPEKLWVHDLTRQVATPLASGTSFFFPVWSPGDSLIAFQGQAGPHDPRCALRTHRLADGVERTLAVLPGRCLDPTDWSANGRYILLADEVGDTTAHAAILAYDRAAEQVVPVLAGAASVGEGALSPDGRWLAYRTDETGTWEVFVRPFLRPGSAVRVSTSGGRLPRWRADGRELYFETPDGRLMAAAVHDGAGRAGGERVGGELDVGLPQLLFRALGWSRQLFPDLGQPYDARGDGERFVLRVAPWGGAAVLVQSWRTKLPR